MSERPKVIVPRMYGIPAELRKLPRWVIWRLEWDEERDRWIKPPYQARDPEKRASSTAPATWARFEEAWAAREHGDGVGFALGPPYVGVDLDEELAEDDKFAVMRALNSYAERSVRGSGYHVVLRANLNGKGRHPPGIGVFQTGRIFYFTGDQVEGMPTAIEERQAELEDVLARYLPDEPETAAKPRAVIHVDLADEELLERARRAHNGAKFSGLYDAGDWNGYSSQSEADLALCSQLAFWTGRDAARMDSLFRRSGLMRDKWDEPRRGDSTYGRETIAKAIAGCRDIYMPGMPIVAHEPPPETPESEAADTRIWLERASDLLNEPDPGTTPFLVEELLVDGAVGAIAGKWKTSKTYLLLELAIAVVTGQLAFGRFLVKTPGPVIVVLEESGRAALHRRLGALARGSAIQPEELAELHYAANRRVRLDDQEWQKRLANAVKRIRPRAVFLDPLARLKTPGRKENAQDEISVLLDFMRYLRDAAPAPCAIPFVHHEGHEGGHMRGSSDLESYWESKISVSRDGDQYSFSAEHREAEASPAYTFRQAWDHETRSVRLRLVEDERREETRERAAAYLEEHPDASANDVVKALGGNRAEVLAAVAHLRGEQVVPSSLVPPGTTPSGTLATGTAERAPLRSKGLDGYRQEQVVPDDLEPGKQEEL